MEPQVQTKKLKVRIKQFPAVPSTSLQLFLTEHRKVILRLSENLVTY